ncbi:MAG: hypothetical protein IKC48_00895 [Clostridia bacterium]|nr:hypothetical protein [Clostridia bacterium]
MLTIIISVVAIVGVIACVLLKPELRLGKVSLAPYWLVAVLGAVALIACGQISLGELSAALTRDTAVNPLKILALFFGMTAISVFLDEAGFFAYLASLALAKSGGSQKRLFNIFYFTVAVLTVFTSNDIVILTFTPFIIYFCRNGEIDCKPYLIAEFAAANTFSMLLIIGNPTNIYLAAGVDFMRYALIMALPALLSGIVCYLLIKALFRKSLSVPIGESGAVVKIKDKPLAIVALSFLALCTVMLAVSGYIGLEMWYIALGGGVAVTLFALIYGAISGRIVFAQRGLMRIPWQLAPFLLSMFTIVSALSGEGVTQLIASVLNCGDLSILTYLLASTLGANLLNNIPMSVLFGSVLEFAGEGALFASVIGSNIGALLTSVGALAGIMWTKLLKTENINYGIKEFVKNGALLVLVALPAAALGLYLSLFIIL